MNNFSYIFMALFAVLMASCGAPNGDEFDVNASEINEYLSKEIINQQSYLKIKDKALGHDFMFYGSFIPMLKSPTGHSLRGRIVNFQVFSDRLVMLESPKGLSIAQKDQSVILLAEFPILSRDKEGVVIDFAKGMKSAFTSRNVHSNALSGTEEDAGDQFSSVLLTISFIKSIFLQDDVLTISQIAQWRNKSGELLSAEFRYFLQEYNPSRTFKKKVFEKSRHVLYFSTPPQIEAPTTKPLAYIAKWDISQPITFSISQNTPNEYRQAIKDGILYWNHMFGKEILHVEELQDDVAAPHHRLNIVQWVSWANEPSAYADMVVDHLTGETLKAQIYIRSGWIFESTKKMRQNLQELLLTGQNTSDLKSTEIKPPLPDMFHYDEPCDKTLSSVESLLDLVSNMNSQEISDLTLEDLTSDVIRAVVAHEMGHVLGLRHNLAASTDGNLSLTERDELLRAYLSDAVPPLGSQKYLSKSMMDVFSASDDALVGSQIRQLINEGSVQESKLSQIYTYDRNAIGYGYFDKPIVGDTPFCSDNDLTVFLDCRRWDYSNTPFLYIASMINSIMSKVATVMADAFIEAIKPDRVGGPMKISDITLTNQAVLTSTQSNLKELFSWFHQNARSIKVEAKFSAFGPQNKQLIDNERFKQVRDQLELKGLNQTLFGILPPFNKGNSDPDILVKQFTAQLLALVDEVKRTHPSFSVSADELAQAQEIASNFFSTLNQDIIRLATLIISTSQFDDPKYQLPIEGAINTIAQELILSRKTEEPVDKALPTFTYNLKTRDAATGLLRPALGLSPDWSFKNIKDVTNQLKQLMKAHGNMQENGAINLDTLARPRRAWLLEQNLILTALSKASNVNRPLNPSLNSPQQ